MFSFLRVGLRCARTYRRYYYYHEAGWLRRPPSAIGGCELGIELGEQRTNEAESARETAVVAPTCQTVDSS